MSYIIRNIGNIDLTSTANTRVFSLNGATSANTFQVKNSSGTVLLNVRGDGSVWSDNGVSTATQFGEDAGLGSVTTNRANFGYQAGKANSGNNQAAFGYLAGQTNSGGAQSAFGALAGYQNTATNQSAFGTNAGYQNTGNNQSAFGSGAGYQNQGVNNSNFGYQAGRFIADGSTANILSSTSVYLGSSTKSLISGDTNSIVIGYNAISNGSNTATIGNTSLVTSHIRGAVVCGNTVALATTATLGFLHVPSCAGVPTGVPTLHTGKIPVVVDSTNNKMYIYSGGSWVALN